MLNNIREHLMQSVNYILKIMFSKLLEMDNKKTQGHSHYITSSLVCIRVGGSFHSWDWHKLVEEIIRLFEEAIQVTRNYAISHDTINIIMIVI